MIPNVWLHLTYFTHLLFSPNMPFFISFLLLCIIQMPYLAHMFCIEALLHVCIATFNCVVFLCALSKEASSNAKVPLSKPSQSLSLKAQTVKDDCFFWVPRKKKSFASDFNSVHKSMGNFSVHKQCLYKSLILTVGLLKSNILTNQFLSWWLNYSQCSLYNSFFSNIVWSSKYKAPKRKIDQFKSV